MEAARFAPGARVVVRGEEWIVRATQPTGHDDQAVQVVGVSELVRGREATFLHPGLDEVVVLDPRQTELVQDDSAGYRRSKLYLESLLRRVPPTDHHIYLGHQGAMDAADYQLVPAARALAQHRARLLIADAVGLGKTIEVGIVLSELIRRGRGRRILVVALKSVLEQFQHELWTRFAIPLVRLDSEGLTRVQRAIPANANPFHHFDRVIISVDTLKKDTKYARLLEQCEWDITVIDECQHVAVRGRGKSQRARLAELLARTCDSLFLTSATPHDGRPESFASLMNLLEPTAVPDVADYHAEQIRDLYVRRFKKDVAQSARFLERKLVRHEVTASPDEDALFSQLADLEFDTLRGKTGAGGRAVLFRTLLLKGLLSSPDALLQTLTERSRRLQERTRREGVEADLDKLESLQQLARVAQDKGSAKEAKLLELLKARKGERVVLFSERIKTLQRLEDVLKKQLKLKADQIRIFDGSTPDVEQQAIVKEFGTENGRIQILLASDAAAEGINLHHQCHTLVHYDIPWSLITLEQRNGRIDRFGQTHEPEIHYLLSRPSDEKLRGDLQVLDRLLEKEEQAHKNLGDVRWLMNLHDAEAEAERVAEAISYHESVDDFFADEDDDLGDLLAPENDASEAPVVDGEPAAALSGTDVDVRATPTLYASDFAYAREALALLHDQGVIEAPDYEAHFEGLTLPISPDLQARFAYLPPELRRTCEDGHVRLSADRGVVQQGLTEARQDSSRFPRWQLLWPLHPALEWLDDRVLTQFARHEAPVLRVTQGIAPGEAVFVIDAVLSNQVSQPVLVQWFGVSFQPSADAPRVRPFRELAEQTGLGERLVNDGRGAPLAELAELRTVAVEAAERHMAEERGRRAKELLPNLKAEKKRLQRWMHKRMAQLELALNEARHHPTRRRRAERERDEVWARVQERDDWITQRLTTSHKPYIRLAAVLIGPDFDAEAARALTQPHTGGTR